MSEECNFCQADLEHPWYIHEDVWPRGYYCSAICLSDMVEMLDTFDYLEWQEAEEGV